MNTLLNQKLINACPNIYIDPGILPRGNLEDPTKGANTDASFDMNNILKGLETKPDEKEKQQIPPLAEVEVSPKNETVSLKMIENYRDEQIDANDENN